MSLEYNYPVEITIVPTGLEDIKNLSYRNNPDIFTNLTDSTMRSDDENEKWLINQPSTSKRFSIFLDKFTPKEGEKEEIIERGKSHGFQFYFKRYDFLGFAGIFKIDNIDNNNRNCMVGMDIIPEYQGLKLATPIYNWFLSYLFHQLNFHMIYLKVLANNTRGISLYQKLGFIHTGYFPEQVYRNGEYVDYLVMSLLRDKWIGGHPNIVTIWNFGKY